jgi:hypothetical protein
MAERNQKVYERIKQELEKNPALGSRDLYELAKGADKAINQDTMQQFHARYFLPARKEIRAASGEAPAPRRGRRSRSQAGEKEPRRVARTATRRGGGESGESGESSDRDRVRGVLLQFAQELTDAESRSSLVKVLGRVDNFVDRIVGSGK